MREFGYKAVALWLDKQEHAAVKAAAERAGMRVASWIRKVATEAAGGRFIQR